MAIARINDVDIFYEVTGEGYPVIWCHEFAGDYRSWDSQVSFFSRLYRNVTFNYRGWPPSGVPTSLADYSNEHCLDDLRGLLDRLGIEQAHFVGLSMGAYVALTFAAKYPGRCRSVVLAGCGTGSSDRERFERDTAHIVDTLLSQGMESLAAVYTKGPTRLPFLRKDPKGWELFREQFAGHSALGAALTWQGVQLRRPTIFDLKEQLNGLRVPTLIIAGDEDEPCIDASLFMKRQIPGAGLLVIPQSGHTINLEEPAAFNQAVLSFLQLVEAGKWAVREEVSASLFPKDART